MSLMKDVRERIQTCDSLPTLPAAALRVLQLTSGDETELKDLAEMIAKDPALSVKVLRAVNSPFYGLTQKVSSVAQAVALLGMHSVKTLVLSFSLVSSLRTQKSGGFDYLAYWRRSMYSAAAARLLASRFLPDKQEECFVAALLMDIGTLLLERVLGEQYDVIYERAKSHQDLMLIEGHELGITHPEAGGVIAKHWKLPDMLSTPIAAHHGPQNVEDYDLKKVTQIVWLAGRCAEIFVNVKDSAEAIGSVRRSLRDLYQIDEIKCDTVLCLVGQKTSELASLFEIRVNQTNYEQILATASQRLLEMSIAERDTADDKGLRDKRRAARIQRDGKVLVIPCARGVLSKPIGVKLRDVSASGIGLTHEEPLELGTQFVIQLPQSDGTIKSLLYAVKRCDQSGPLFSIGAELMSVLRPQLAGEAGATPQQELASSAAS
jgi:HD-like signal output (HDOD) protein